MDEDKTNEGGTSQETILGSTPSNIIDFLKHKEKASPEVTVGVSPPRLKKDPDERRLIVVLKDHVVKIDGYVGLTNTFLAVGNKAGQIKFAAAPGFWQYVTDITDLTDVEMVSTLNEAAEEGNVPEPPERA